MLFRSILTAFEHQMVAARHPVVQYWNAGLDEGTTRRLLDTADVVVVPELLELYRWKNGQVYNGVASGKLRFGAPGVFWPLEVALQEYALSQKEHFYAPHFFPLFDDELLLNLDPHSPHRGCLYRYCPSLLILTPERMYDSLPALFGTLAACFAQGIYWYDTDGYFDYDLDAEWALSQALNPHATYWQSTELGNGKRSD